MKKIFVCMVAFLGFLSAHVHAQSYETAIGAKFYSTPGSFGGLNIRHATAPNIALEGSLLFRNGGMGVEGLYQYQGQIDNAPGLMYFAGGGGLLGFGTYYNDNVNLALRLTVGLDYTFAEAPFNVSLGLDPFFNLTPHTGSHLALGIGLRYVLK